MNKKETVQVEMPVDRLVIKHARCPNGHDLMDAGHKINDHPAVTVRIKAQGKEGSIHLDPVYGSFANESDIEIGDREVVDFFCPECGISLEDPGETCQACSAPMFAFMLPNSGIIEGCLRNGCTFHHLKLVAADELMDRLNQQHILDAYL